MTQQYNTFPTYDQPISEKGGTARGWYRFFQGLAFGVPPGAETAVTVGTSPFTYTAPRGGAVIVQGGIVSAISFARVSSHVTGATQGLFPVSSGDMITITYTGVPTVTFVPQ